ncbi:MAG: hypothetical protein HKN26_02985 [Acidimicrobiales bacterium]|nr:hypothetical protein [Acidimicrobiales bacterium]
MSSRILRTTPAHMADAVGMVSWIVEKLNADHGAMLRASINVGTEPSTIAVAGGWEDLDQYQNARFSMAADAEIQSAFRLSENLFDNARTEDHLMKIHVPAGETVKPVTVVNTATMMLTRVAEAVAFGVEVSTTTTKISGVQSGFATALTGPRADVLWWNTVDSLADAAEVGDKLEADPGYLDLFARSDGLYQESSLEQSLWVAVE